MAEVLIKTDKGDLVATIYEHEMPITGGNFMKLVREGYYTDRTWHRIEPNFVIQGGSVDNRGGGDPGFTIRNEAHNEPHLQKHRVGALSMATTTNPHSGNVQFFIVLNERHCQHLNGKHTIFGQIIEGLDILPQISVNTKFTITEIL